LKLKRSSLVVEADVCVVLWQVGAVQVDNVCWEVPVGEGKNENWTLTTSDDVDLGVALGEH
jgi:hypothetical protein